jgi:hypothetical protein
MTDEELIKRLRSGVQDEDYSFGDDPAITEAEDIMRDAADCIEQLNAKLAKAVDALAAVDQHEKSAFFGVDWEKNKRASWRGVLRKVRAVIKEITGDTDD